MAQKRKPKHGYLDIYCRNGRPIYAIDEDGNKYQAHRARHSKHIRNK